MARRKRRALIEDDEPALDISSLIDVCFLLLIYFLVTSTIQPREQDLPMTLPSDSKSSEAPVLIEPMLIKVKKSGSAFSIVVNDDEVLDSAVVGPKRRLPRLFENLTTYSNLAKANDTKPLVQLFIDPLVEQQTAMDILNCLKGAGINSLTFSKVD